MFTYLTIDLLTDESIAMIWINGFVPDQYQLLFVALLLDALVGELGWIFKIVPHPIAILGRLIGILEAKLNRAHRSDKTRLLSGGFVVVFISALSLMVGWGLTVFVEAHRLWVLELLIITILVAQRSLYLHVRAVAVALDKEDLAAARRAVAHVVGRDPEKLDKGGVARAAIETLAELMRSGNDEQARGTAAQALLDRGWGKPKVEVVSDEAGYVQALRAGAAELDERPDNKLV